MALPVTKEELHRLVDGLPETEVVPAARFLEYLSERRATRLAEQQGSVAPTESAVHEGKVPYRYPTVPVPWEHLMGLVGLLPEVPGGDALEDTEALYDEV